MKKTLVLGVLALLVLTPGCGGKSSSSKKVPPPTSAEARQVTVKVMWASARKQYGKVWPFIHPSYQAVTTRAFWESCARKKSAKLPAGIEWISFTAPKSLSKTVKLPLLGSVKIEVVTIRARFKYRSKTYTDSDTIKWTAADGSWRGVWSPADFAAFKAGRCPS